MPIEFTGVRRSPAPSQSLPSSASFANTGEGALPSTKPLPYPGSGQDRRPGRPPKRLTVSTRPRSSIGAGHGVGLTTGGSWSPSATSRRPKPRNLTTPCWNNLSWRRDSNPLASDEPGAVHPRPFTFCWRAKTWWIRNCKLRRRAKACGVETVSVVSGVLKRTGQ